MDKFPVEGINLFRIRPNNLLSSLMFEGNGLQGFLSRATTEWEGPHQSESLWMAILERVDLNRSAFASLRTLRGPCEMLFTVKELLLFLCLCVWDMSILGRDICDWKQSSRVANLSSDSNTAELVG
ncbi:hypothetical protein NPIL_12571 [Nephila pilipes]|uniref:Uncharacterized protein n=1 Tax=Nephila pilipes TaxID=299642 RepID=A0A8X6QSY4_NEPPI|nr:hypothetical protein NPIL_12571 [Nephila pilipes]